MALAEPSHPTGDRSTAPILIIDDELEFLETYERLLRRLGYETISTERGREGLRIAQSRRIRLVVTDLHLPDIDGLAIVEAVRAQSDPPPVIVVSAAASPDARRAATAAGAAGFLAKPFSVAVLVALIRAATA
jgi:DNA-binding response OmpR family regulator